MPASSRRIAPAAALLLTLGSGCLPYTVGSTARTVAPHETTRSTSWYFIPNAVKLPEDSVAGPLAGTNVQFRHGLDERSDFGLIILPGGVAADYKRRIDAPGARTAVSYILGGGIVNGGEHMMLQASLVASGAEEGTLVPYGGLRAIHVLPISSEAVHDRPTIGAFGGFQIGDADFTIRPELGVFYDHSALGLRRGDIIFVPAITLARGRRSDRVAASRVAPRPAIGTSSHDARRPLDAVTPSPPRRP